MPIVSSELFQDNHEQRDGSRWVGEFHTENTGKVHKFEYKASRAMMTNRGAVMAARAEWLNGELPEREADEAIGIDRAPVLAHQTGAAFLARLRDRYRNSEREVSAKIARWICNRIDAGSVTREQLRGAFGMTAGQWDNAEAKMRALKAAIDEVGQARGE